MSQWIKVSEPTRHVLHVELCRPPVNAFTAEFWKAFGTVFDSIAEDPRDIRVVVLSSSFPKLFTAGLDLNDNSVISSTDHLDPFRHSISIRNYLLAFQKNIRAPERCPVPVIVAVHGQVIGLGVDIMCACDIRYASSDALFKIAEVDVGLAADIGTLAYLPRVASNQSLARELAYTAQPFSAIVAHEQLGLVSKVVQGGRDEVINAAFGLAAVIASKSPSAVMGTKRLLIHARDHSVDENLEYTSVWNSAALLSRDTSDAIQGALAKKPPKFASLKPPAKL